MSLSKEEWRDWKHESSKIVSTVQSTFYALLKHSAFLIFHLPFCYDSILSSSFRGISYLALLIQLGCVILLRADQTANWWRLDHDFMSITWPLFVVWNVETMRYDNWKHVSPSDIWLERQASFIFTIEKVMKCNYQGHRRACCCTSSSSNRVLLGTTYSNINLSVAETERGM